MASGYERALLSRFAPYRPRQQGKRAVINELICQTNAAHGGTPGVPIMMQVRGVYVIWETTGEVRTSERE